MNTDSNDLARLEEQLAQQTAEWLRVSEELASLDVSLPPEVRRLFDDVFEAAITDSRRMSPMPVGIRL